MDTTNCKKLTCANARRVATVQGNHVISHCINLHCSCNNRQCNGDICYLVWPNSSIPRVNIHTTVATEMDAKDSIVVLLLLLSLGLFGSLTYCVWNKQSQRASELDDQQSQLHELQNQCFQVAPNDRVTVSSKLWCPHFLEMCQEPQL